MFLRSNINSYQLLFTLRFSNRFADSSDIERTIQKNVLKRFFIEAPVFGHGLGSYSTQSIRSFEFPYSYELHVLALFGQVGILGIVLFTCSSSKLLPKSVLIQARRAKLSDISGILLICFLASGFFNPAITKN
jgi:hypothetical protein